MTETQERFLKVIAERIPPERVVELHLFPSLRQGPIESGVAVIAAEPMEPGGGWAGGDPQPSAEAAALTMPGSLAVEESDAPACDPTDDAAGPPPTVAGAPGDGAESSGGNDGFSTATPHPPPATRYTIYTARYRLTIKGPDRGKWEATVAAEADAPLVTLEAVVRGVRHRAGEGADTERLSGDEFRAALAAPAWTTRT